MSPRLKLRAAATPLVLAGALWGGQPAQAAPPVHAEQATLQARGPATAQPAGSASAGPAANAPTAVDAAASSAVTAHGPAVHYVPARPMLRQTPPACSPDGVCTANVPSFGWYKTRWRTFPGDLPTGLPTEATKDEQPQQPAEGLGGLHLPTIEQEGSITPQSGPAGGAPPTDGTGAEGAADPGAGAEAAPADGGAVAPAPGAEAPATSPLPGLDVPPTTEGNPGGQEENPLDPFGGGPPKPPAWLSQATTAAPSRATPPPTLQVVQQAVNQPQDAGPGKATPAALIEPASTDLQPAAPAVRPAAITVPVFDGPNLHGDDAPPALPEALKGYSASSAALGAATMASVVGAGQRPLPTSEIATVDRGVVPASAEQPVGIQLINPAAAVVIEPDEGGLQQAIYFEASDLD